MKTNWPTKKLGDLAKIVTGKIDANRAVRDGVYPFYTCADEVLRINNTAFDGESILVAGNGDFWVKYHLFGKFNAYQRTYVIQNFSKETTTRYLYFVVSTQTPKFKRMAQGGIIKFLHLGQLKDLKIPLPPVAIQKQIIGRLDKIAEAQKLNGELIQKSDELFQSLLHQELKPAGKDWKVEKIKDVVIVKNGGTPSTKNPKYWNGKVLWLTPKELSGFEGMEISDTERKISDDGLRHSSATILPVGTVLLTSRAPIGYIAIAGAPMATNQGFKNFICDSKQLNNKFLYFFLRLKTKYLQSLGRGATFTEISKTAVEKIDIPLPPLETQKQIVAKLSAVQEYKTQLLAQKSKLKELFSSALAKSFKSL